jgi:hypothetical protein
MRPRSRVPRRGALPDLLAGREEAIREASHEGGAASCTLTLLGRGGARA